MQLVSSLINTRCVQLPQDFVGLTGTFCMLRHAFTVYHVRTMRSFTGMGRITGMVLSTLLGQSGLEWPQKMISPRKMQFRYRKMDSVR